MRIGCWFQQLHSTHNTPSQPLPSHAPLLLTSPHLSKPKIRINSVSPGVILGNGMSNYPAQMQRAVVREHWKASALKRLGTESEISSAVVFLLGAGASFVTGATLRVDGGSTCSHGMLDVPEVRQPVATNRVPAYVGYPPTRGDDLAKVPAPFQELLRSYVQGNSEETIPAEETVFKDRNDSDKKCKTKSRL